MPPDPEEAYEAAEPLYVWSPAAGVMPQLAYRAGELVPGRVMARHPDWRAKVRARRHPAPVAAVAAEPRAARGKTSHGKTGE
jgi:hypothetical protein